MTQKEFIQRFAYSPSHDRIGGGSFGTVYKAYDNVLHREVAIKVSEVKISADGKKTFSLKDEFEALNHVPKHPNIANYEELYSFEMPNGIFDYAVMQYYPDGDLSKAIKQGVTTERKEDIAIQLLKGIGFLHQHKVVHRDLKPGNILVVKHAGRIIPLITDFGLSKAAGIVDGSVFSNSFGAGTPRYSSPEQLQGQPLRFNTDLWSYGAIIYELFTGEQLFSAGSGGVNTIQADMEIYNKIVHGNVSGLGKMPGKWLKIAERCLVVDAEKRAKDAEELFSQLKKYKEEDKPAEQRVDVLLYQRGKDSYMEGDYDLALEYFNQSAKMDNAAAQYKLAEMYMEGLGVESDLGMAQYWLGKSSKQDFTPADYLAFKLDRRIQNEKATVLLDVQSNATEDLTFTINGVDFVMKFIEGGAFQMGASFEQGEEAIEDETAHLVTLNSFYIGETQVTQALWETVLGYNPSRFKGKNLPVDSVEGNDMYYDFIRQLNKITGKNFRLPTEAEWEFAARGGIWSKRFKYSGSNDLDSVAWYGKNSNGETHPVKQKRPNELGLYDMSGNVSELCDNSYAKCKEGFQIDSTEVYGYKWIRGGNYDLNSSVCRVSSRKKPYETWISSWIGFRLLLPIE